MLATLTFEKITNALTYAFAIAGLAVFAKVMALFVVSLIGVPLSIAAAIVLTDLAASALIRKQDA